MAHLYKMDEWQGGSGQWYCNDVADLGGISGEWWIPARMLEMSLDMYVKFVVEKFKPDTIKWNGKTLIFSWADVLKERAFKNYINTEARKRNFKC